MKAVILFVFTTLCIIFFPILFLHKTFFFADNFMLMVPGKIFATQWIKQGIIPQWNPYIFSGVPFLSDISQSLIYPSTLLFLFFQPGTALSFAVLIHLFWGACGIGVLSLYFWKKKYSAILSAVVWMFSPIILGSVNNLAVIQSTSWLPWMIFCALQICDGEHVSKHQIFLTFCMALSFLGGHPYPIFYGGVLMGLLALAHPSTVGIKIQRLLPVMVLFVMLSAVVLFPFVESIGLSTRAHMSTQETTTGVLRPAHVFSLLLPNMFSDASKGIVWGADWGKMRTVIGYVSVLGFIALISLFFNWKKLDRRTRVLLSVGFLSLLYTFGVFLPIMNVLYVFLPGFRFLRSPGEAAIIWVICSSLLVGIAFDSITPLLVKYQRWIWLLVVSLGLLVSVGWIIQLFVFHNAWQGVDQLLRGKLSQSAFHTELRDGIIIQHILKQMSIAVLFVCASMWSLIHKKKSLFVVLFTLDLWIASSASLYLAPNTIFTQHSDSAAFLQTKDVQNYRFLSLSGHLPWTGLPTYWDNMSIRPPFADSRFTDEESQTFDQLQARRDNLAMDWGMPYTLQTPMGYGAFVLQSSAEYWKTGSTGASVNSLDVVPLDDARLNEQGVRFVLVDTYVMDLASIVKMNPKLKVASASAHHVVLENAEALPIVRSDDGEITEVRIDVRGIAFTAHMKQAGKIFIAESWYPGWKCAMQKTMCEVQQEKGGMSIQVPQGDWEIELKFQYRNFPLYAMVSISTLVGLLVWGGMQQCFIIQKRI